jgi:hypothetical protein
MQDFRYLTAGEWRASRQLVQTRPTFPKEIGEIKLKIFSRSSGGSSAQEESHILALILQENVKF